MSREFGWMMALAVAVLVAAGPAAYADQWTADHVHSAAMNANQTAHVDAEHHAAGAGTAAPPRLNAARARTMHVALNRQANELSHQNAR